MKLSQLIGYPWMIVIGGRHLAGGPLEVRCWCDVSNSLHRCRDFEVVSINPQVQFRHSGQRAQLSVADLQAAVRAALVPL